MTIAQGATKNANEPDVTSFRRLFLFDSCWTNAARCFLELIYFRLQRLRDERCQPQADPIQSPLIQLYHCICMSPLYTSHAHLLHPLESLAQSENKFNWNCFRFTCLLVIRKTGQQIMLTQYLLALQVAIVLSYCVVLLVRGQTCVILSIRSIRSCLLHLLSMR